MAVEFKSNLHEVTDCHIDLYCPGVILKMFMIYAGHLMVFFSCPVRSIIQPSCGMSKRVSSDKFFSFDFAKLSMCFFEIRKVIILWRLASPEQ